MCDIVFKKENCRDGMVKRTSDFTRAAVRKDSIKNMKNRKIYNKSSVPKYLF